MLPGLDVLEKTVNKKKKPDDYFFALHWFTSKGITPKQFKEEYTIPEILGILSAEKYIKEKERKAMRKK